MANELGELNIRIHLKDGESYELFNLPGNCYYEIVESASTYKPSYTVLEDGVEKDVLGKGSYQAELSCEGELEKDTVVKFTNLKENNHSLQVGKGIEGDLAKEDDEFPFTVTFTGLEPNKTHTVYLISEEDEEPTQQMGTFTSNASGAATATFRLKAWQIAHISGLKDGCKYKVTESASNYTPSFKATIGEHGMKVKSGEADKGQSLSTGEETLTMDMGYQFTNRSDLNSPEKTVSDTDNITWEGEGTEVDVTLNTVKNLNSTWTYKISQDVPEGVTDVLVSDTYPYGLVASNIKVFVDGVDRTDDWTYFDEDGTITAYNEEFSGSNFTLIFDVSVNHEVDDQPRSTDGSYYKYVNNAFTMLNDTIRTTNDTETRIPVDGGLTVSKNVKGSLGDTTKNFEFTANLTGLKANTTYTFQKPELRFLNVSLVEDSIVLKVTDKGEQPLNKVKLVIAFPSGEEKAYTTNANGEITLSEPDEGLYIIENGDGYVVFSLLGEDLEGDTSIELAAGDKKEEFTSNASGNATVNFTLHDDESVLFSSLPEGATYVITESASDHIASYSLRATGDNAIISKSHDSNSAKGESLATATERMDANDGNVTVIFTNTRNMATETGIYSYLKYWIALAGLLLLFGGYMIHRRRKTKALLKG